MSDHTTSQYIFQILEVSPTKVLHMDSYWSFIHNNSQVVELMGGVLFQGKSAWYTFFKISNNKGMDKENRIYTHIENISHKK